MARLHCRHGLPRYASHSGELLLREAACLPGEPELGPAGHRRAPAWPDCDAVPRLATAAPSGPKHGGLVAVITNSRPTAEATGSRPVTVTPEVRSAISQSAPAGRQEVTTPASTRPFSGWLPSMTRSGWIPATGSADANNSGACIVAVRRHDGTLSCADSGVCAARRSGTGTNAVYPTSSATRRPVGRSTTSSGAPVW